MTDLRTEAAGIDKAGRYLLASMTPTLWAQGTGWVHAEVVDDMVAAGYLEERDGTRDGEPVRLVRLSVRGITIRAMIGPDGTLSPREMR